MKLINYIPFFLLLISLTCCQQNNIEKPNIIFILADDLGYGDLSCYGATKVNTPNIDRLAIEGMRFTDAHSPASVCTPSRYNLLTGRYAWRTYTGHMGVWINDPLLIEQDRMTIASLLKEQGYTTACVGKWHLGYGEPNDPGWDPKFGVDLNKTIKPGPLEVGFDYYWGFPHVGQFPHIIIENHNVLGLTKDDPIEMIPGKIPLDANYLNRDRGGKDFRSKGGEKALYKHENLAKRMTFAALDWLKKQRTDQPFFLYLAHRNIHSPLIPNKQFQGKSSIGRYGDFIIELDWTVGKILDYLDEKGLAENTLVFFSSDNGAIQNYTKDIKQININGHLASGVLRGQKTEAYEGGNRVPFMARWPQKIKAGSESKSLIAMTDMLATFADFFSVELPENEGEDSYSFLGSLLSQPNRQIPREVLVADSRSGFFAIRKGKWKLITGQHGGGTPTGNMEFDPEKPEGQLYNLEDDISETTNLYKDHPEIVKELSSYIKKYRSEGRSTPRNRN